jgi:uncharacterized damage-inducible protein DinB
MKELLNEYASYSYWANKVLMEKLLKVPGEILQKETGSSFGTIYKTVFHLFESEMIWWQRMNLQEQVQVPKIDPSESFEHLSNKYLAISKQLTDWVNESNEQKLLHVFGYYNSKKEFFKQPVYQMMMQLFNHETYHRGQIVAMLRQNGVDKVPATDFIVFSRKK